MNRLVSLTSAQKETLAVIEKYTEKHDCSPTITELAKLLKLSSLRSVGQRIEWQMPHGDRRRLRVLAVG